MIPDEIRFVSAVARLGVARSITILGDMIATDQELDMPEDQPRGRLMIADIQRAVAEHYGIPAREMVSARRSREVARPRQVAMYLAKRFTPRSPPEIGRRFGGRDHTTVIYAISAVERRRADDPELDRDIRALAARLAGDKDFSLPDPLDASAGGVSGTAAAARNPEEGNGLRVNGWGRAGVFPRNTPKPSNAGTIMERT